jgi:hypothetical protein
MTKIGYFKNLTPEQQEEFRRKQREKYNSVTKEQKEQRIEKRRQYEQSLRDKKTPEQIAEARKKSKERWDIFESQMTLEEKEALRVKMNLIQNIAYSSLSIEDKEKRLEAMRLRHSKMTPEEIEHRKDRGRKGREKLKEKIIRHYSNGTMKCVRCGFSDIRALSIDHIYGGGRQHYLELKKLGMSLYDYLFRYNFPEDGYQVLCLNCQFIKRVENHEARSQCLTEPIKIKKKYGCGQAHETVVESRIDIY